jgi:hypothetical protein
MKGTKPPLRIDIVQQIKLHELGTRVDFVTADGRVLFAVSCTDNLDGLNVRVVDPAKPGMRLVIEPEVSNSINVFAR